MGTFLKKVGRAALVVGGFLVVFFGSSKFSSTKTMLHSDAPLLDGPGVAHADAPYAQGYYQGYYYTQGYYYAQGYYQGYYYTQGYYYGEASYYVQGTYGDSSGSSGDSSGSGDSGGSK